MDWNFRGSYLDAWDYAHFRNPLLVIGMLMIVVSIQRQVYNGPGDNLQ